MFLALVLLFGVAGDGALLGLRSSEAQAQARLVIEQPQTQRSIELNIHGTAYYGFDWIGNYTSGYQYWSSSAVGLGLDMLFPVLKNGFIPSLNNAFYLGFFTDFLVHSDRQFGYGQYTFYSLAFGPVAQWRFILLDLFQGGSLSVFANVGFGLWPWFLGNNRIGVASTAFLGFPLFELGGNLFFNKVVGLTFEFGYPAVKLGVKFAF
jgi:hypothetical protein